MTEAITPTDDDVERLVRALGYHAALITHLIPGYDLGAFDLTTRADALTELIRAYANGGSSEASAGPSAPPDRAVE